MDVRRRRAGCGCGRAASGLAGACSAGSAVRRCPAVARRPAGCRARARVDRGPRPAGPAAESFRAWWRRTERRTADDERPRRRSWPGSGPALAGVDARPRPPCRAATATVAPAGRPWSACSSSGSRTTAPWSTRCSRRRGRGHAWPRALAGGTRRRTRRASAVDGARSRRRRRPLRRASSTRSTPSSPRPRSASPRPAPSCSTTAPDQGRRALTLVPDLHVCVVRADQVVADVPEAVALLDPRAAADLDQRPVGHQRHRARPGRGRPRPAHPARGPRRVTGPPPVGRTREAT